MLRIILICGILGFIGVIAFMVITADTEVREDLMPQPEATFPESQDISEFPEEAQVAPVVREFELTPDDYVVNELPTSGLVTSLAAPDPSEAFSQVLSEIYIDIYWVLECKLSNGSTDRAVILTAQSSIEEGGGDIDMARYAIRNWESNIAKDIGATLFPESRSRFSDTSLDFTNYDRDSRFAQFTLGQNVYEIHYGWVLNFAIFATSHDCLVAAINDTYAPQGH